MGNCQRTEQNQENSFVKYFKENYKVKNIHKVKCVGHMLYLPYWKEIIEEIK